MAKVKWFPAPPAVPFAKFEHPGEQVQGLVIHYHPTAGTLSYDKTRHTGLLVVEQEPGDPSSRLKIGLNVGNIDSAVRDAMIEATLAGSWEKLWIAVRYEGEAGSGKTKYGNFRARTGVPE